MATKVATSSVKNVKSRQWAEGVLPQEVVDVLIETEKLAEDVVLNEQQTIELDKRRQRNRECLSSLKKQPPRSSDKIPKTWICAGDFFIKMPTDKAIDFITDDQLRITSEINNLREQTKDKMLKLHEMERQSTHEISAMKNLKAMRPDELESIFDSNRGRNYQETYEDLPD
eukprot:TRINITY_DN6519_c0_g1_i1.p1 TRINITY_DN6519_c0_g1~~TRINITY_DN6519_c0_g1_i1.p1  ORF type:complete len:171 (+),score=47.06 TRINITY_DN6519_c0_g1_i1:178-690(+)